MRRYGIFALTALLVGCGGGESSLPEDSIVRGVNYVGAVVSDLDATADLYGAATDLNEVDRSVHQDSASLSALAGGRSVTAETRMLRTVNAQLQLMSFEGVPAGWQPVPVQGPGIAHICLQVAQSTSVHSKLIAGGAAPVGDAELVHLNPRNPVYYGYLHDHDKLVIEVEEVDVEKLDLDQVPPNKYRIRHVSLATSDADRLVKFYGVLLDQPKPRRAGGSKGFASERIDRVSGLADARVRMAWFQIRNLELEIFQYTSHPTDLPATPRPVDAPGYNMIVLDVTDLEAAKAKFLEAGGTIETEAEDFNGAPTIFGRDPDGNIIGLQVAPADSIVSSQNFSGNGT